MAYVNEVKFHNLRLRLDLPADAPEGHPHIIDDLEAINENDLPDDLTVVDVVATVLYKWDPEALQNLLDLTKETFHFGHVDASGYETYIIRKNRSVRVGAVEKDEYLRTQFPDFEVKYRIRPVSRWELLGGCGRVRDKKEEYEPKKKEEDWGACAQCETLIASHMLGCRIWDRDLSADFWYEVNGRDRIGDREDSDEEMEEDGEGGNEVEGDPESIDSSSTEVGGVDAEPPKVAPKRSRLMMECGY